MSSKPFINGVNYGNLFIPEDFFADDAFFKANGIPKVAEQYSLCDLKGPNSRHAMETWLD